MIGLTSMEARTLLRDRDSTHLLPDDFWVRITNALPWSGESLYLQVGYVADKRPAKSDEQTLAWPDSSVARLPSSSTTMITAFRVASLQ